VKILTRWARSDNRRTSRDRRAMDRPSELPAWPRKEAFACCLATRDEYGRLCVGDCGPTCQRRAARRAS